MKFPECDGRLAQSKKNTQLFFTMDAEYPSALVFKNIVEAVKEVTTEVNFSIDDEGLRLQAMDQSHVSLVMLHIVACDFNNFKCTQPFVFGVKVSMLSLMLRCCENDGTLQLHYDASNPDKLTIIYNDTKGNKTSTFALDLIDLDTEVFSVPEVDYTTVIDMQTMTLQRTIKNLSFIGDTCAFDVKDGTFAISVDGQGGSCQESFDASEMCAIRSNPPIHMSYALRYIHLFLKVCISDIVHLKTAVDIPLCVEQEIGAKSYIQFFLAPKIVDG